MPSENSSDKVLIYSKTIKKRPLDSPVHVPTDVKIKKFMKKSTHALYKQCTSLFHICQLSSWNKLMHWSNHIHRFPNCKKGKHYIAVLLGIYELFKKYMCDLEHHARNALKLLPLNDGETYTTLSVYCTLSPTLSLTVFLLPAVSILCANL